MLRKQILDLFNPVNWFKFKTDSIDNTTYENGKVYYDMETQNYKFCEANGTIVDLGRENVFYIKNQTGADLLNMRAVMYAGSLGASGRLKGQYALSNPTIPAMMILGISTETISNGASGKVTYFGEVTGDTTGTPFGETWLEDDILYVSSINEGWLTKVMPQAPNPAIPIAVVTNVHSNNGHITVRPTYPQRLTELVDVNGTPLTQFGQILVWDDVRQVFDFTHNITDYTKLEVFQDSKQLSGFPFGSSLDISYNFANRTITVTGDLTYYWCGEKRTLGNGSAFTSIAHTATNGAWFLYTTDGINFTWSQTAWEFTDVMIAYVNYGADTFAIREAHQLQDPESHEYTHNNFGTYKKSGGTATVGTFILNTATDAATTPGFDIALVSDEDLESTIPAWIEGTYTTMYVNDTTKTSVFSTTDSFPFKYSGTTYIQYNNVATGTLANGAVNRYYNIYQILMPTTSDAGSQKYRTIFLQAQNVHTTVAAALAEDTRLLKLGALGNLSPEFTIHARLTYGTSSAYSNTGKVQLRKITYLAGTKLSQVSISGTAPASHNGLTDVNLASDAEISFGHLTSEQYNQLLTGYKLETQAVTRLSTSTFSLPSVTTGIKAGMAIKYSTDGINYLDGLISNITGTTFTVRGVSLPTTISNLYYYMGEVIELSYPLNDDSLNVVADNVNTLYENISLQVAGKLLAVTTKCVGNATTPAQIQIRRGTDVNDVLTANLNVTDIYTNSGVTINSLYNTFDFETVLSIDCLNIGNGNGTGIILKFYFIKNY